MKNTFFITVLTTMAAGVTGCIMSTFLGGIIAGIAIAFLILTVIGNRLSKKAIEKIEKRITDLSLPNNKNL